MVRVKGRVEDRKLRLLGFLNRVRNPVFLVIGCVVVTMYFLIIYYQDYDPSLSSRTKKWLAKHGIKSMKKGGVVLFLHRKNTGGSSIKVNLNKKDFGVIMTHPHAVASYARSKENVELTLSGQRTNDAKDGKIYFLAVHEDFATLPKLREDIEAWRDLANKHRTSFFCFTLIRNPVDFHVSSFNRYRVPPCLNPSCIKPLLEPTEENLLSDVKPNEQCRGLIKPPGDEESVLTADECNQGFEWMRKNMDWIGTTEKLSAETLPLLAELVLGDANRVDSMHITKNQEKTNILRSSSLQIGTIRQIQLMSDLDEELYKKVTTTYLL